MARFVRMKYSENINPSAIFAPIRGKCIHQNILHIIHIIHTIAEPVGAIIF